MNADPDDWAGLSHLIALVDAGSIREAARRLRVSVNTVRTRLAKLEKRHGAALIVRAPHGIALSARGEQVYRVALNMRKARLGGNAPGNANDVLLAPGRITIACTEGLGIGWLTPRTAALKQRLPDLIVDLRFDYDLRRDRSAEADIGLSFLPPANPDLIVTKLATLHFMLFASPAYLRQHGTPTTIEELREHLLVEQVTPGYNSIAHDLILGADRPQSNIAVQTNSSMTQLWAAASGAGIAALPTYTRAVTSLVVPLPILPQMRFPVSCYYRAEAKQSRAVRETMDWLREAFDTARYPWFADTFVHPDDFPASAPEGNVVELYEHMADRIARIP